MDKGDTASLPPNTWGSRPPLTLQPSPACDVAGVVVGKDFAGGREAAQLDLVTQGDRAGQFEQGNVVPGPEKRESVKRGLAVPVLISFLVWPPLEPLSPSLASLTVRLPPARAARDWGAAAFKPQVTFCLWWSLEPCTP